MRAFVLGKASAMGKRQHRFFELAVMSATLAGPCLAHATSPYAGQEMRGIKSLAKKDVHAYLAGKGMGLAKSAELNGYPGPAHVLSLADTLSLSAQQTQQTEALFNTMKTKAKELGRTLAEKERQLDQAFSGKSVTRASLQLMLGQIAAVQARLRQVHLEAHLEHAKILTPEQIASYNKLRG
jgi:Spy/CpxP family protein refolding chaperone